MAVLDHTPRKFTCAILKVRECMGIKILYCGRSYIPVPVYEFSLKPIDIFVLVLFNEKVENYKNI